MSSIKENEYEDNLLEHSRDKVRCGVCGDLFKAITNSHLNDKHSMDFNEYEEFCEKNGFEPVLYSKKTLKEKSDSFNELAEKGIHPSQRKEVQEKMSEKREKWHKNNEMYNKIDEEALLSDMKNFVDSSFDKLSLSLFEEEYGWSKSTVQGRFDVDWGQKLKELGADEEQIKRSLSDEELLNDLERVVKAEDKINTSVYQKKGSFQIMNFYERFGSFKNALSKIGIDFELNQASKYTKKQLLEILSNKLSKDENLTTRDFKEFEEAPCPETYSNRFGSWSEAKKKAKSFSKCEQEVCSS